MRKTSVVVASSSSQEGLPHGCCVVPPSGARGLHSEPPPLKKQKKSVNTCSHPPASSKAGCNHRRLKLQIFTRPFVERLARCLEKILERDAIRAPKESIVLRMCLFSGAATAGVQDSRDAACSLLRSSKPRTSSSVVWEKSWYQRPTAWNGSGVIAETTSSTSERSASQVSGGAIGTATTMRAGRCRRSDAAAASIVEPVARPSSTRITVRPRTSEGGRSPR